MTALRRRARMPGDRPGRVGFALTLAAIVACGAGPALAQAAPTPSVQVTGEARESRIADRATIGLRIETNAATSQEATRDLTMRVERVLSALKSAGIVEADTESDGPAVQETYENVRNERGQEVAERRRRTGFSARYGLSVTVADLAAIPGLLPRLAESGALIEAVDFSLKDARALRLSIEERAVADALDRARRLVAAAGSKPGRVLAIAVEGEGSGIPYRAIRSLAAPAQTAERETKLPVRPGRITVDARVSVTLEILAP